MTGISPQTINSAIRRLEKDGIVCLEQGKGRNTVFCLTEKGKKFVAEKIDSLYEAEDKIWNEWTDCILRPPMAGFAEQNGRDALSTVTIRLSIGAVG